MRSISEMLQEAKGLTDYADDSVDRSDALLTEVLDRTNSFEEAILALQYCYDGPVAKKAFSRCGELAQTPVQQELFVRFFLTNCTGEFAQNDQDEYWWRYQEKAASDPSILSDPLVLVRVLGFEMVDQEEHEEVERINKLFARAEQISFPLGSREHQTLRELQRQWEERFKP